MPSKTPAQRRLMEAAAHNPQFAKKVGAPQKVAREFVTADKKKGGKVSVIHYYAASGSWTVGTSPTDLMTIKAVSKPMYITTIYTQHSQGQDLQSQSRIRLFGAHPLHLAERTRSR